MKKCVPWKTGETRSSLSLIMGIIFASSSRQRSLVCLARLPLDDVAEGDELPEPAVCLACPTLLRADKGRQAVGQASCAVEANDTSWGRAHQEVEGLGILLAAREAAAVHDLERLERREKSDREMLRRELEERMAGRVETFGTLEALVMALDTERDD